MSVSSTVISDHHDRDRGADVEAVLADRDPVGVDAEQVGVAGDAARPLQHVDLGEHPEVPQHRQRREDQQDRPDGGKDHVAEAGNGPGTVELGRLDQLGRGSGVSPAYMVKATNGMPIHTTMIVATMKNDMRLGEPGVPRLRRAPS